MKGKQTFYRTNVLLVSLAASPACFSCTFEISSSKILCVFEPGWEAHHLDLVLIHFFFAVFVLAPVVATIASHRIMSNILKEDLLIFGKSFSMLTLTVEHVALEFAFE